MIIRGVAWDVSGHTVLFQNEGWYCDCKGDTFRASGAKQGKCLHVKFVERKEMVCDEMERVSEKIGIEEKE